jgi:hypothetical protein
LLFFFSLSSPLAFATTQLLPTNLPSFHFDSSRLGCINKNQLDQRRLVPCVITRGEGREPRPNDPQSNKGESINNK